MADWIGPPLMPAFERVRPLGTSQTPRHRSFRVTSAGAGRVEHDGRLRRQGELILLDVTDTDPGIGRDPNDGRSTAALLLDHGYIESAQ